MIIFVIIVEKKQICSSQSTATKFDIDLVNIIILTPWKFSDIDPQGTAAMLMFIARVFFFLNFSYCEV